MTLQAAAAATGSKDVTLDETHLFAAIMSDPALALLQQVLKSSLVDVGFKFIWHASARCLWLKSKVVVATFDDVKHLCCKFYVYGPTS